MPVKTVTTLLKITDSKATSDCLALLWAPIIPASVVIAPLLLALYSILTISNARGRQGLILGPLALRAGAVRPRHSSTHGH